jgi:Na+/H+-dicarboxylate symporter
MNQPSRPSRFSLRQIPLYLQILIALVLAVGLGVLLGAGQPNPNNVPLINNLVIPCTLILKALRALATPLILLAVIHSFLTATIPGKAGRRIAVLLITNTLAAILIGLAVANILQPGKWGKIDTAEASASEVGKTLDPWGLLQSIVPDAVLKPLVDNNVIQLIFLALAFGIVLRGLKAEQIAQNKTGYQAIENTITLLFESVIRVLHWVIALVPLAVFGIVAKTIALQGFAPFKALGAFIVAVLVALVLQASYYLLRVQFGSWVSPKNFLLGASDALFTALSTASSTATMPITFEAPIQKVGL